MTTIKTNTGGEKEFVYTDEDLKRIRQSRPDHITQAFWDSRQQSLKKKKGFLSFLKRLFGIK